MNVERVSDILNRLDLENTDYTDIHNTLPSDCNGGNAVMLNDVLDLLGLERNVVNTFGDKQGSNLWQVYITIILKLLERIEKLEEEK